VTDDLADRLDAIADEIAERAIAALQSALRSGAATRPPAERRLTQARRAVEKAAHLLRTADDADDG
jgi:DNA-binding ferritin-like protein